MTKAERTKQLIIEKAAVLINKKGMAGTSVSDIMDATKLAKGGIYGNFGTKDDICIEAYTFLFDQMAAELRAAIQDQPSFKARLFAYLDHYQDNILFSDRGGCPMLNFGVEADDTNPEIKQRVASSIKFVQSRISNMVTEGVKAGEFRPGVDAVAFGIKMLTMLEGAIMIGRTINSGSQMKLVNSMLKTEIESFCL